MKPRNMLQARRIAKGKTQVQIAEAAGMSRSYYEHIERGYYEPSQAYAARLARVFRCTQAEFWKDWHDARIRLRRAQDESLSLTNALA